MLRVGIIGSGFGMYGLLPAFSTVTGCQVVGLCAQATPRVQAACQRYNVPTLYSDWRKLLANSQIQAIAIAVTPEAQHRILKVALKQGLHAFAEKPLANTLPDAQELLTLAQTQKVIHGIDFIFPRLPAWQHTKQLLSRQTFGTTQSFFLKWTFLSYDLAHQLKTWKTDPRQSGGALAFFFSHSLHYLEWLFGPIASFKAALKHSPHSLGGGEVGVKLDLDFESGVHGKAVLEADNPQITEHTLAIQTNQAILTLANQDHVTENFTLTVSHQNGKSNRIEFESEVKSDEDERVTAVKRNVEAFVTAIQRHHGMSPSFIDGVRVQTLIEHIRSKATSYEN